METEMKTNLLTHGRKSAHFCFHGQAICWSLKYSKRRSLRLYVYEAVNRPTKAILHMTVRQKHWLSARPVDISNKLGIPSVALFALLHLSGIVVVGCPLLIKVIVYKLHTFELV